MNYVDIIFILFLGIFAAVGVIKGFVKTVIDFASGIIAFLVAGIFAKPIAVFLSGLSVFEPGQKKIELFLMEKAGGASSTAEKILSDIKIPDFVSKYLINNMDGSATKMQDIISELASGLYVLFLTAIVFIVILIIVRIIFFLLDKTIKALFKKVKLLKNTDKALGGILGLLNALFIVSLILALIALGSSKLPGITNAVSQSLLVDKIYQNNILLKLFYN